MENEIIDEKESRSRSRKHSIVKAPEYSLIASVIIILILIIVIYCI